MDIKGIIISGVLIVGAVGGTAAYYNHKEKNSIDLDDFEPVSVESTADDDEETSEVELVPEVITLSVQNLKEIIEPASQLITTKYKYTNAADIENYKEAFGKKVIGTTTHTVFTYDGVISGGIDFSAIEYNIDNDARTIEITLPAPEIIANELDTNSFRFYDVSNSIFTDIKPEETIGKLDDLKKNEADKLIQDGEFLKDVNENAETLITSFLKMSDEIKDYTFTVNITEPEVTEEAAEVPDRSIEEPENAVAEIAVEKTSKYTGENYQTVINKLTDIGFTNISEAVQDPDPSFYYKAGDCTRISINGVEDFKKGDKFPADSVIRIYYK